MPASVKDRLTCTWEPIYLLVRSRHYHFDLDAIRIPPKRTERRPASYRPPSEPRANWAGLLAGNNSGLHKMKQAGITAHPLGKNPGDVWTIATTPAAGSHHAGFPETLITRPILAGCPEKVCTACQRPWQRPPASNNERPGELRPTCRCQAPARAGVVLDPFIGSGTVAVVADQFKRDWIGIELSEVYAEQARQRITANRAHLQPTQPMDLGNDQTTSRRST